MVVEVVLQARQFLVEQADVVVIEQRDGSGDLTRRLVGGLLDQLRPDQVAKCFRAGGIAATRNQLVELSQQTGVDGNADPLEFLAVRC